MINAQISNWLRCYFAATNKDTPAVPTTPAGKGDVAEEDDDDDIMEVPVTSGDTRKRNASNDEVCEIVEMPATKKPKFDEVSHFHKPHLMDCVP